jgi:hypothetical protein
VSLMEKPGVLEKLGSALNSSDLSPVEGRTGAVELIGALGYTQINPDALEHGEHELAAIDPRTEVGALLVRIKYGGDRALTERAVRLLIAWVHHQRAYRKWKLRAGGEGLLEKFVRTGFGEWLDPVCRLCCGREMLGLERGAIKSRRVRCTRCGGAGSLELMPRNPKFTGTKGARGYAAGPATRAVRRPCTACHGMGGVTMQRTVKQKPGQCWACNGTGVHRPSAADHALALGVDVKVYERHWAKRFSWLSAALDRIDHTEKRCLQAQMEHGIKPNASSV